MTRAKYLNWWRKKWGLFKVRAAYRKSCRLYDKAQASYKQNEARLEQNKLAVRRRFFALLAAAGAASIPLSTARADTAFTAFAFPASGAPTNRTMPDRLSDIFNAKDYGCVGDNSTDNKTAIRAWLAEMWGNGFSGGVAYAPPGIYKTTEQIDIASSAMSSVNTTGSIIGAGRDNTWFIGDIPNGFVFRQASDGASNGPAEIKNLRLYNSSTWIGSGALSIGNTSALIENVHFTGMIGALVPFNAFELVFRNCTGAANSDVTTGYNGTIGISGYSPLIYGWRSTTPYAACLSSYGSNGTIINGAGIENCNVAIQLGLSICWASSCTVSGDILTVGGTVDSTELSGGGFSVSAGSRIWGRGLPLPTWGSRLDDIANNGGTQIIGDHFTDPTLTGTGSAGTYRINQTLGSPITTPIPVISWSNWTCGPIDVSTIETEACRYSIYLFNAGGGRISGGLFSGTPTECVDQFGNTGFTSHSGIYTRVGGVVTVEGIHAANNGYAGGIYFEPGAVTTGMTFLNDTADKLADVVTTSTLTNGSGGSGNILNVASVASGSTIGIGMAVTGTGVPANTVITGNHASDPTLTGAGATGTYTTNNSANLSSRTITVHTQDDWVMPLAANSNTRAGLKIINCNAGSIPAGYSSGLNNLVLTFNELPGQAGCSSNIYLIEGLEYDISDGTNGLGWGDPATNTGTHTTHYRVRYNGTNWTVVGK